MLLLRLTLCDVGVFLGRNTFELAPRRKYGQLRPVVLFGGLNGAGKTTLLSSLRLVLYGRQALGHVVSLKAYHEYLRELIHRKRDALVPVTAAEIGLEFAYAHGGDQVRYLVRRRWEERGKSLEETVTVEKDGEEIRGLSIEQANAFLAHLVPPGVSQFFFFDGEKIASLAKDEDDSGLAESVKKLLGLDMVGKLKADLTILLRQKRGADAGSDRAEYALLEKELAQLESDAEGGKAVIRDEINPAMDDARRRVEEIRAGLAERGGAWAIDRTEAERQVDRLNLRRSEVEASLREYLAGIIPFALAPQAGKALGGALRCEAKLANARAVGAAIESSFAKVDARLHSELPAKYLSLVRAALKGVLEEGKGTEQGGGEEVIPGAGLSDADRERLIRQLEGETRGAIAGMRAAFAALREVDAEQSEMGQRLAAAPSEESLREAFSELESVSAELGRLQQKKDAAIEELRRKTWASIDLVRKLRRLEAKISGSETSSAAYQRGERLLVALDDFARRATDAKVRVLRTHLLAAFRRLARKDDLVADVKIDRDSFAVTLLDRHGRTMPKKRLSAGEKQIFAIAMLEALGRTSGRNLPVVIDTPLGRLDSKHRSKLMESYFPRASHQVVVLSTDTEVDEPFYRGLSRHISHAYHLRFDESDGCTHVDEGYFWRDRVQEVERAA